MIIYNTNFIVVDFQNDFINKFKKVSICQTSTRPQAYGIYFYLRNIPNLLYFNIFSKF